MFAKIATIVALTVAVTANAATHIPLSRHARHQRNQSHHHGHAPNCVKYCKEKFVGYRKTRRCIYDCRATKKGMRKMNK